MATTSARCRNRTQSPKSTAASFFPTQVLSQAHCLPTASERAPWRASWLFQGERGGGSEEKGAKSTLEPGQLLLVMQKLITSSEKSLLYLFPNYFLVWHSLKQRNSFLHTDRFTDFAYLGLSLVQVLLQAGVFLLQVIALECGSFQRLFCYPLLSWSISELFLQPSHCSLGKQCHGRTEKKVRSQNLSFDLQLLDNIPRSVL